MSTLEPRICFVGHAATLEGAGRYLLDQASYLIDHGVRVFVILPYDGPLASRLSARGAEVQFVPNRWWVRPKWAPTDESVAATVAAARLMAGLIERWRIDVVYTQTIVAPAGPLAAVLANKPHIWHVHEFAYNPGAIEMAIPKTMLAALADCTSNAVFFNSKSVEGEWSGLLSRAKTEVVCNWVRNAPPADPDPATTVPGPPASENAFIIAITGSLQRWKRQLDAVRAVHSLVRRGDDVHLWVIGPFIEPDYVAEIQTYVTKNAIRDRVHMLGFVDQPGRLVSQAHVSVVCSDNEPFGRVTIESMALGVPVVATNSGGTPEIIEHGVDGLLYETGDVDALVGTLERLRGDDALRSRLGVAAKLRAADFANPDKAMEPVMRTITDLVGQENPAWPLGSILSPEIPIQLGDNEHPLRKRLRRLKSFARSLVRASRAPLLG